MRSLRSRQPRFEPEFADKAIAAVGHAICKFAHGSCLCERSPFPKCCVSVEPKATAILRIATRETAPKGT